MKTKEYLQRAIESIKDGARILTSRFAYAGAPDNFFTTENNKQPSFYRFLFGTDKTKTENEEREEREDDRFRIIYSEDKGDLKIYLPDGDLYKGKRDPVPVGGLIWNSTGLPYSTVKDDSIPKYEGGTEIGRDVLELGKADIVKLGYTKDVPERLLLVTRRPHNIPRSVQKEGMGISGKDFIADRLKVPVLNGAKEEEAFMKYLEKQGILQVLDLGYKPTQIVFVFPTRYGISTIDELKYNLTKFIERNGGKIRLPSEFEELPYYGLEKFGIPRKFVDVERTPGKTEPYAILQEADGFCDIVETGKSIIDAVDGNGKRLIRALKPPIIDPSTPRVIVNKNTYQIFRGFFDELFGRLDECMKKMKKEYPEYWEKKADPRIFDEDNGNSSGHNSVSSRTSLANMYP